MKKITTLIITLSIFATTSIFAADGSWNVDADGDWSTNSNWTSDTPADGVGATANFTNDITAERNVTLDSPRTIGNINFADGGGMQTINFGILGGNLLNLDNNGSTPVIDVTDFWAGIIGTPLTGSDGFNKTGSADARLLLNQNNSISGTVTISSGYLTAYNDNALPNADVIIDGGVLEIAPNINANMKSVTASNGNGNLGLIKPYPGSLTSELSAPITANFVDAGNSFLVNVDANCAISLNGEITLATNTAMGITGGDGNLNINAPIVGNHGLRLLGRWETAHTNIFYINAACTYGGWTTLHSWGANPRFEIGANQAFPCGGFGTEFSLLVDNSSEDTSVTLDLNDKTQKVSRLVVNVSGMQSGHYAEITGEDAGVMIVTNVFWSTPYTNNTELRLTGGTLILENGSSFDLPIVVENATFINNGGWPNIGNSFLDLKAGAKIGGSGVVGWTGGAGSNLVIPANATISPGNNSINPLVCWNLEMQSGSLFDWEVENGTVSDHVDVRGLLDISSAAANSITVNVSVIGGIDAGNTNMLFYTQNGSEGISGNADSVFLSYEVGITGPENPTINVNTNMVIGGIIPEPGIIGLLGLVFLAFLRRK